MNAAAEIQTDYFLKSYWKMRRRRRRRRRERRNNTLEAHILMGTTGLCCMKKKKTFGKIRGGEEVEDPAAKTRYVSVNLEAYCRIS